MTSIFEEFEGIPRARISNYASRSRYDNEMRRPSRRQQEPVPDPPMGELLESLTSGNLARNTPQTYCGITETEVLSSYNWIFQLYPKIMVPGKPRLWTPPVNTTDKIPQDNGTYYRDRNAAAYNEHPMEAAVVSVLKMRPKPTHHNIDVVACSSTIGNLIRFIQGDIRPFRMLIEFVGSTVHLIRRENSPTTVISGVKGYGHTFPNHFSSWESDVPDSRLHQRVLKYKFGGLDVMLRSAGDGYIGPVDITPPESPTTSTGDEKKEEEEEDKGKEDESSLLSSFKNLSVQPGQSYIVANRLEVVDGGNEIPQDMIFELKTRSIYTRSGSETLAEEMSRLWACQVHKFIFAQHEFGCFNHIEIMNTRDGILSWERDNQPVLRSLAKILRHLVDARLRIGGDVKLEIVRLEGGNLEIRKRLPDAGTAFSEEVHEQWAKWLEGGDGAGVSEGDLVSGKTELGQIVDGRSEDESEDDFTACDEECGYCGRCRS